MSRGTAEAVSPGPLDSSAPEPDISRPPVLAVVGEQPAVETPPAGDLVDLVIRLVRTWSTLKAKLVASVGPELSSMFLVGTLVRDGPTRAKDLAEATNADQSTVSRQVAGLVKAGLIERQADPDDGRACILVPTASGVAEMEKHFANRGRALEPLMADWSDADRGHFLRLLDRFTCTLESRRDEIARAMAQSHSASISPDTPPPANPGPVPAFRRDGRPHPAVSVQPHASTERSH